MSEKVNPRAPSYIPVLVGSHRPGISLLSTLFTELHSTEPANGETSFRPETGSSATPLIDVDGEAEPAGNDPAAA